MNERQINRKLARQARERFDDQAVQIERMEAQRARLEARAGYPDGARHPDLYAAPNGPQSEWDWNATHADPDWP